MSRAIGLAAMASLVVAAAFSAAAIWTHDHRLASELGNTGALAAGVAIVLGMAWVIALDVRR